MTRSRLHTDPVAPPFTESVRAVACCEDLYVPTVGAIAAKAAIS